MTIKPTIFSINENFFPQSCVLLFPILFFSSSLEISLTAGTLSIFLIYSSAFLFLFLRSKVRKTFLFLMHVSLACISGVIIGAFIFFIYPETYQKNSYLINLLFISILVWHRNILSSRMTNYQTLNKNLLPSLIAFWLSIIFCALVRELLCSGSLNVGNFHRELVHRDWTLPFLSQSVGSFLSFFATCLFLKISPVFYPIFEKLPPKEEKENKPEPSLEKTLNDWNNRLENILKKTANKS